jgi:hypothetical protein
MKTKNFLIAAVAGLIGLSSLTATAMDSQSISDFIPDASEVSRSVVVITPPGIMTRAPLGERELPKIGCASSSEDGNEISHLLGIVKNNIRDVDGDGAHLDLRHAVYFYLKNGTTIRYLINGEDDTGKGIYGLADNRSAAAHVSFIAKRDFLAGLRKWALDNYGEKKTGNRCFDNK